MIEVLVELAADALFDSIKLFPFLAVTYLALEYLEHRAGDKVYDLIRRSGRFGPLVGAVVGLFPQCGFSVVASNFYAARVITLGTLLAVYLSTSDEMLPVLLANSVGAGVILKILGIKMLIGLVAGFVIDFAMRRRQSFSQADISVLCHAEKCNCEEGSIFKSAMYHAFKITLFIFVITFLFNVLIEFIGEDSLSKFILNRPVIGEMTSGLIGLIPNCSASVIITQLYVENAMSLGTMLSGTLVSSGAGLLVLFKVNRGLKNNLKIVGLLYAIGVGSGILVNLLS